MSIEDAGSAFADTLDIDISGRMRRNPYGMLAGALGIGFVLGGGIFTRLTARILGAGLRVGLMAALPILQQEVVVALTGSQRHINNNNKENDR